MQYNAHLHVVADGLDVQVLPLAVEAGAQVLSPRLRGVGGVQHSHLGAVCSSHPVQGLGLGQGQGEQGLRGGVRHSHLRLAGTRAGAKREAVLIDDG